VVLEERYWYPDDGGIVWVAGYQLVDAAGRFVGREAPEVAGRGLLVAGVAGAAAHHADALADERLTPGFGLTLRRDAGNPHDANAIAVDLDPGGPQLGWVPRDLALDVAPSLDAGDPWSAVMLREQRRSPRDPRTGITMLLAPAAAIKLRSPRGSRP
jgi:HIRAN domain-containing protein